MSDCTCSGGHNASQALVFGEDGELGSISGSISGSIAGSLTGAVINPNLLLRPCDIGTLNGSWLLEIVPRTFFGPQVRGPLRIEVGASSLRVSGDLYAQPRVIGPITGIQPSIVFPGISGDGNGNGNANAAEDDGGDTILDPRIPFPQPINWYPSFPKSQYSWYFRSAGATYADGTLTVSIVRHLWNRTTQEFAGTDQGRLVLTCRQSLLTLPIRPIVMTGTLTIGGSTSNVKATRTSPFYRGCRVEVDAMVNRNFPASATIGSGAMATFRSVYATAGWDIRVVTDEINIPEDGSLTNAELSTLLTGHGQAASGEDWRLWLLVGSAQGTLFGIMFDDDTVPREGAAGFADAQLGGDSVIAVAARNQALNNVPAAFLRTLVHEAGHAFNLFHPKHDVHNPGIGTEIMNQTGDVIGFATAANPYPNNATFSFSDHDRTSLIHSPDPQVRPGWKNFGWGHGSLSAGLPSPVDVAGLDAGGDSDGLTLTVELPTQSFVGEYLTARLVLTNTGDRAREVTTLLNLSQGDLTFLRSGPEGVLDHVLDIAVGCGPRPLVTLRPGQAISGYAQLFFTNQGVTFTAPGRHTLVARLEADPLTTVFSAPLTVDVRTPGSDKEVDISAKMLTKGVGKALALGDFAADEVVRGVLTDLAEAHSDTDTGAAGAMVLANALARSFTDYRDNSTREAVPDEAGRFLDLAVAGRSARRAMELAVTVASPTEKDAPVVADTLDRVRRAPAGRGRNRAAATAGDVAVSEAEQIAADFVSPQPR